MTTFGLSLMPEAGFVRAALPLFESGIVEAVEWSFDMGWHPSGVPDWLESLLTDFSNQGRLIGHGISYSLLGATGKHEQWLALLAAETERRDYQWISEHVGFVGAGRFSFSAPLPMPADHDVIQLGQSRMTAMSAAAGCDVGLENLATCLGPEDASDQGELLRQLLAPVDGFLVLDLHNLYCQGHNTGIDPIRLMAQLPLDRVRELHVSGGSWSQSSEGDRALRRDTHDGLVPNDVLDLLGVALMRCDNLEVVIYERMGSAFGDPAADDAYRKDVELVATIVGSVPNVVSEPAAPLEISDMAPGSQPRDIAKYQANLLDVLSAHREGAKIAEAMSDLEPNWNERIATFDADLLEVASSLTRTWGKLVTK